MPKSRYPLLAASVLLLAADSGTAAPQISLSQQQPRLEEGRAMERSRPLLSPGQPADRRLPFTVEVTASCPAEWTPVRAAVSVTEAIVVLAPDQLGSTSVPVTVEVPARQLRMMSPRALCEEKNEQHGTLVRLPEMVTAFGTLVCQGPGGEQRSVTRSTPLDIWLFCPLDP
ncbi:MAG: hypothetical protein JJT85_03125 [Chromatiales bacterium]|nr:hypothetical protein [Chromatiales bacterium]